MTDRFNGSAMFVREESTASPEFARQHTVDKANERSANDPDFGWFSFFLNTKNDEFGIALSDRLRDAVGMKSNFYQLSKPTDERHEEIRQVASALIQDPSFTGLDTAMKKLAEEQASLAELKQQYTDRLQSVSNLADTLQQKLQLVESKETELSQSLAQASKLLDDNVVTAQELDSKMTQVSTSLDESEAIKRELEGRILDISQSQEDALTEQRVEEIINQKLDEPSEDASASSEEDDEKLREIVTNIITEMRDTGELGVTLSEEQMDQLQMSVMEEINATHPPDAGDPVYPSETLTPSDSLTPN